MTGVPIATCGENGIANFERSFVIDMKLSEFELIFPDPTKHSLVLDTSDQALNDHDSHSS